MAKSKTPTLSAVPAVTPATEVTIPFDMSADAGAGFESAGKEAYAIPFLTILQSMSPQCKKSDGAYIKGAEEGMIFNTVSGEVFDGDEGVEIIPCAFSHTYVEWGLREAGGGFVAEYDSTTGSTLRASTKRDDKGRDILPNGHHLGDHRNHYLLVKDDEGHWSPVLMSLTSTQIKASRNWMSDMQRHSTQHKVPMFALRYRLTTVPQQNDKGSWYGAQFEYLGFVEDEAVYNAAKSFYLQVKSGGVKPPVREDRATITEPDDM